MLRGLRGASIILIVLFFTGCSSSNDVVADGLIQKRKYRKGFHLNLGKQRQDRYAKQEPKGARPVTPQILPDDKDSDSTTVEDNTRPLKPQALLADKDSLRELVHSPREFMQSWVGVNKKKLSKTLEEDPANEERTKKESSRSLIFSSSVLAFFLITWLSAIFLGGILGSVALWTLVIISPIGFAALCLTVIYFIERLLLNKGVQLFQPEQYRSMGAASKRIGKILISLTALVTVGALLGLFATTFALFSLDLSSSEHDGLVFLLVIAALLVMLLALIASAAIPFVALYNLVISSISYKRSKDARRGFWMTLLSLYVVPVLTAALMLGTIALIVALL